MGTAIENFVQTAKDAGVPKDQFLNFVKREYVPLHWQWKFHARAREADLPNGPVKIGAGGARGPGKSHGVFAQVTLDDCQRVPGLKGLFIRQTGVSARESFEDLVMKVLVGRTSHIYNRGLNTLTFPNGSRVILGGFHDDRDIDKYIGIEYDFIAIEELNQLHKEKVDKLLGSMRTSKQNWRPRMYASFNPGGLGHQFVKDLFVTPFVSQIETSTRFVRSTYKDNPHLNIEYVQYLEGLEGNLGKAWREGNFDIFEGQYFNEWNTDVHIVHPFSISSTFKRYRAYDHGRENPACCKWYAVDYDGRVWVYREYYPQGKNVDEIAAEILRLSEGETYQYSVSDPSIFHKTGFVDRYGGQTIAESFARDGVIFLPASNRRVDGWSLMHQYLSYNQDRMPKLIYFNTCYNSIRTIPTLIHDELHPEDLDTRGEDHAADTDRYFLMSLHETKSSLPKTDIEKKFEQMRQKSIITPSNFNDFYANQQNLRQ